MYLLNKWVNERASKQEEEVNWPPDGTQGQHKVHRVSKAPDLGSRRYRRTGGREEEGREGNREPWVTGQQRPGRPGDSAQPI